jgi:diacylglycerol O-acyltransferase / wax synthase
MIDCEEPPATCHECPHSRARNIAVDHGGEGRAGRGTTGSARESRVPGWRVTVTRMSSADAAWLGIDAPDNLMMVTAVLRLQGPIDWTLFADVVQERIVARYPTFRQRALRSAGLLRQSVWSDDPDFDLAAHVVPGVLTAGSESELADVISDLLGTPLDMTRSPWQFHQVDGPMGSSTIVARLHHCIADGIALATVLLSLTDAADDTLDGTRADAREGARADAREDARADPRDGTPAQAAPLHRVWGGVRLGCGVVLTGLRVLAFRPDPRTCLHARLGTRKRAAWTRPIELDRLKDISRSHGVTLNDVALAVTAGALRRYLLAQGESARDLRIFMPVNLRPQQAAVSTKLGNRFGLVFLSLPISQGDPVRRLRAVHERSRRLKAGRQAAATFVLLRAVGLAPRWAQRLSARLLGARSSAVVTNVRGPGKPVTLAGAPVDGVLFWVPQTGSVGLGISILSYAGTVTVGIAADRNVVDQPSQLADAMEAEIAELEKRLG